MWTIAFVAVLGEDKWGNREGVEEDQVYLKAVMFP